MNREDALKAVRAGNPRERLEAARALRKLAENADVQELDELLRGETVSWVRSALQDALRHLGVATKPQQAIEQSINDGRDEIFAAAVEETTGRLVHELKPIAGAIRLYVSLSAPDKLERELDRLDTMLEAIETLGRTASAPRLQEFDLSEIVADVLDDCARESGPYFERTGPEVLVITGDASLIRVALRVGVMNAIEATLARKDDALPPILVAWDRTDKDVWVAVLDGGTGLPLKTERMFEIGVSSKAGHQGMGLALASRALLSLNGKVSLTPRQGGGARYELRWPLGSPTSSS